jgi:hypothetical protein
MNTLISFNNDHQLKSDLITEVLKHQELDQIIQGTYGKENGIWKGCAVGCSIHSLNKIRNKNYAYGDHSVYEKEFGVPRMIARLSDKIFEGLDASEAKRFPLGFWNAVQIGKNLDPVWRKFLVWLLVDENDGVIKHAKRNQTKEAITNVANLIQRSILEKITSEEFLAVRRAARAADAAAYASAAAYAASAAAYAAADAADAAADAAAYAAADAADADADAADAAYASADADADADAADARKTKYKIMADKLIELLEAA